MRDEFHSAFRICFQGTVMVAMSLHGPLPVFFLPTARQRRYTFAPLVNPVSV